MSRSAPACPLPPSRLRFRHARMRRPRVLRPRHRRPRSRSKSSDHEMIELPATSNPETCARYLRELGASDRRILPIAEAALALASCGRPRVGLARYYDHLRLVAGDVGAHADAAGDLAARARALNEIILLKYGYSGDELT